ncbi:MAG: AAA family ATPase [Proteobacteria bacterium]|nr:AAA family ATPase [Pseudomonadota bacterium]
MELLERDKYLQDLTQWLNAAVTGSGSIALVCGEAGIGKTSLLQQFSRQQRTARVLWGACDALFTPRPLAPVHDIARQSKGPLLAAIESGASRDKVFSATLDEFERGAAALVVFEDVHWADEATLDLLKFLGRRIQRTKVMLAMSYRDDEVGARHPLRFVIGDFPRANTHRAPLPPLSKPAVEQLAKQAGRAVGDLYSVTGGNPLFVTEALAGSDTSVPVMVRDAVLARAVRLSPAAREIAELVSVVPGKTEGWLLAQAGCLDEAAIESCLSIGMLRGEDGSLAFRHELARRAFEDSLSQARQQALHAKVLATLAAQADSPPARLAHHANGARNTPDVLRFATLAAAHAANIGSHRESAAHYRVALRHADKLAPGERAALYEHYSYECYMTDQIEQAIEARQEALELRSAAAERLEEGDNLRWLSRLSWFASRGAAAREYAVAAVSSLEHLPPGPELAMAYSNRAQLDMLGHHVDSAIDWAKRTIELAERLGRLDILSHALNNLGTARLVGDDPAGRHDLERSLQLALEGGFQEHVARAYTNLSSTDLACRSYRTGMDYLEKGIAYCDEYDLDSWRLYMLAYRARAKFEQADWNGASEDLEGVLRDRRTAPVSRILALTTLGHMRIRRGDPDPDGPLEESRTLAADSQESQRIAPLAAALAETAWLLGERDRVIREVAAPYELIRQQPNAWATGMLAIWLWRAGALETIPQTIPAPFRLEISGDWQAAADAWAALGCPYERANMLGWYGGEPEQREALSVFEQLGATPAAQALRKQMRARGIQGIPRGSRVSTRLDPHGLTKREAEILQLVAQGLRNSAIAAKLFLSTKTVDHHVSAILTKLGVPSRAEAAAMARKLSE